MIIHLSRPLKRYLAKATFTFMLMFAGTVCFADGFGELDDLTMQVIGPDDIPADVIQNIYLPGLDQIGINQPLPNIIPGTSKQMLPGSESIAVEPIPFDPANPFRPIDSGAMNPGAIDPGYQPPPFTVELPVEIAPIDFYPPPDPNTLRPDGRLE